MFKIILSRLFSCFLWPYALHGLSPNRRKSTKTLRKQLKNSLPLRIKKLVVEHFTKSHAVCDPSAVDHNLCLTFFSCLLDKNFTSFDLTSGIEDIENQKHPFAYLNAFELVKTVSERSPNLETLRR